MDEHPGLSIHTLIQMAEGPGNRNARDNIQGHRNS